MIRMAVDKIVSLSPSEAAEFKTRMGTALNKLPAGMSVLFSCSGGLEIRVPDVCRNSKAYKTALAITEQSFRERKAANLTK